jgi:CBS domain containing-hemolysin-like protein
MGLLSSPRQPLHSRYGDMRAREVMKPRGEIDFVLTSDSPHAIAERAIATGRTRLPLCEPDGGLESAVGVINAKDLLPLIFDAAEGIDVAGLARPLAHISESARVDEVLREMRERRVHLALVHDEHGTVIGLLSMEDILEELVGDIEDEFDPDRTEYFDEQNGRLWVSGEAPIRALAARLGFELEGHHETTVGGYLSEQLARVPDAGELVECHGHRFKVLAVDETRITELAVVGTTVQG